MVGAASSLQGRDTDGAIVPGSQLSDALRRRGHRRQTLAVQAASYGLGTGVLLIYAHAGTIPAHLPSAFFLCGITLIGVFAALSETHVCDRFDDHYLTVFQVCGHGAIQLGFVLAAPQIGFAFLNVLFLIFGVAALRMTSRQAAIAWTLTVAAVALIFLLDQIPIGLPMTTTSDRLAAAISFALTIGQCAFVGLYGDAMRKALYRRSVELGEAYQRIEELAELDELTGSFNRRCIMRMLEDEIVLARRSKAPCSIALIDLDWFKRINDAFGHPTGDEVLRTFAITVFANIRQVDRFGRYGGEEFLLVLPGMSDEGATRMLNRLRMIVADLDWSALSPSMLVTFSAGVATMRPNETPDTLLSRADKALYAAKARGRNRIAASN